MRKTERKDVYKHILKYAGIFGSVQGLNILIGIIRNKFVAMILGPDGMGLTSLFTSSLSLISNSTNLGLPISGVRHLSNAYETKNKYEIERLIVLLRSWTLFTALLGMFVCVLVAPFLDKFSFTWGDHTIHFMLLSPIVGLMAITAGETTILKATRNLKPLAILSLFNIILSLSISVPLFYIFKEAAIIPSIFVLALIQMLLTLAYSYRLYPFHVFMKKEMIHEGSQMLRLGMSFVIAGIMSSGSDFFIRSFLNTEASLTDVGLYNAGYIMMMTCASMVFASLDSDYFPRLAAIASHHFTMSQTINRQIEITFLCLTPILITFVVSLPLLIPLLYSGKFLPVLGMMQVLVFEMYIRSVRLPIEYIPLAKGDSKSFLLLESLYYIILSLFVIYGFKTFGLLGAGYGIVLAGILDFLLVIGYAHWHYGYHLSQQVLANILCFLPLCFSTYALSWINGSIYYWVFGGIISLTSLTLSFFLLRKKMDLWVIIQTRIKRIIKR